MLHRKNCRFCGNLFECENRRRLYCSKKCQGAYERSVKKRVKKKIQPFKMVCRVCKSDYLTVRTDSVYCSRLCYNKGRTKSFKNSLASNIFLQRWKMIKEYEPDLSLTIESKIRSDFPDDLSRRWELLWRICPRIRNTMLSIEKSLPVGRK